MNFSRYEDAVLVSLKKLGRYDLIRVLGRGAMGIVYEGRDPNLERRVAIKTVKVEDLTQETAEEYEARFLTEARSAARLQHPNIVSVYDSDRDLDIAYLVMEYIEGEDLKRHLDKGIRYSLEQSLKMIRDLLSALDYAHKQGIVHRDVKPANLLIEPGGRVKLTDFGVARIQNSSETTRTQGNMVGTLKYMSPEQVQGQKTDARADLFSVGVVLYQLLTDKRPFDGDNDFSIIHQIIGHTPAPPSSFNARLPSAIDAVVARALAKDRDQRFATARDFAAALQSAIRRAEDQTVTPPADPFKKADRAGTGSKAQLSMPGVASGGGGPNVTQEVELVYWKDIKESIDPDELQGFLDKFPAGIYADLARRRLRKLSDGSSPDQTMPTGAPLPDRAEQDPEVTQRRDPASLPVGAPVMPEPELRPSVSMTDLGRAGPASEPDLLADSVSEDRTLIIAEPLLPASAAPATADLSEDRTVIGPFAALSTDSPAMAPLPGWPPIRPQPASPAIEPPRKVVQPPPVALLAGLGAVAVIVVGMAAYWIMGSPGPEIVIAAPAPSTSSPAAAAPAPEVPPAPPVVLASANPAGAAVAASAAQPVVGPDPVKLDSAPAAQSSFARPPDSAARRPGTTAAKPRPVAPAPPVEVVLQAPPPAPSPAPEEPKPASTPRVAAMVASPVDSCKDKFFVMKELCLTEQCKKPGTQNHPLCVKHRADAELRGDSKTR